QLNVLLARHAGTAPMSLDRAAQEVFLHKALVEDPEGRALVEVLTSRRSIPEQTRGYRKLAGVAGIPGLALRGVQDNPLALVVGVVLLRAAVRGLRAWRRDRAARREHLRRLGFLDAPVAQPDGAAVTVPQRRSDDLDPEASGEIQRELAV